jgi:hypothetical protein
MLQFEVSLVQPAGVGNGPKLELRSLPAATWSAPPLPEGDEGRLEAKRTLISLFAALDEQKVDYCHWKSNVRLQRTLAGLEDVDILVGRSDLAPFQTALLRHGFKLAQSRAGLGHVGVFHWLGLDAATAEVVDVHAYCRIVSGDSFVKNYRFGTEATLLTGARMMHGVRVPAAEAELALFALRIVLKHTSPVELLKANRRYGKTVGELQWLRDQASEEEAAALCASWFPAIGPVLFRQILAAVADPRGMGRRVLLGWKVARRLRSIGRLRPFSAAGSRGWRVLWFALGKLRGRRDLVLGAGGIVVALVGPKATGKSTLSRELAKRLGRHLDVALIHAGKPPPTVLSFVPRLFVPIGRALLPRERLGVYEMPQRRAAKRYSLLYVLRMTLLAHDRRRLLRRAFRQATAGTVVISDRYPSGVTGAIDSSCFDEEALAKCTGLKRLLMRWERRIYRDLPRPDLVLRLRAPLETAIQRDELRGKEGGPDPDAIRRRWDLEIGAEFSGTPLVEIDTSLPVAGSLRAALLAVWSAL